MPGHTNGKVTYKVYGTNEAYEGKVVEVGGFIYSTESGALEGVPFGQQLFAIQNGTETDVIEDVDSLTPLVGEQTNGQQVTTTTTPQDEDVVTPFVVGDGSQFGIGTYFYSDGSQVPIGTELHHHTIIPMGRASNFMTQHVMDGNDVDVFTNVAGQVDTGTTNQQNQQQTQQGTIMGGMGGNTGGGISY
tara:strand:+ start:396 stop:962 length:567 start_codon:yes stop_codon:yes gene_type:complete